MNLVAIIDQYLHEDVMIAFSGGVDSTLLLKIAVEASKRYHTHVYAVTIQTDSATSKLQTFMLDNEREVEVKFLYDLIITISQRY